jgi:putative membrane protein
MTTEEFLISSWPMHAEALVLAAALVCAFTFRWRTSSARRARRAAWLGAALVVYLLTLNSPLDALANGYLFSAHMLQHLLLLLVVPPLLLLAWVNPEPREPAASARRAGWQRVADPIRRVLTAPVVTWLAGVGAMWFWHVPTLCSAATSNPTLRIVQAFSLLVAGTLFWVPILGPMRQRLPALAGVLYLFTACVGCTLLGIGITFSPVSVCPVFMHPVDRLGILGLVRQGWGLTPGVDQQIGGLLMWVPACFIYACGIVALLARWYATARLPSTAPAPAPAPWTTLQPESSCELRNAEKGHPLPADGRGLG